jgi:ubiquitin-protein ligase
VLRCCAALSAHHPRSLPALLLTRVLTWHAPLVVPQILTGIQELLDSPNNQDAAQEPAWRLFGSNQAKYIVRVKEEVRKYIPTDGSVVL